MELHEFWRVANCLLASAALIYLVVDFKKVHLELSRRRLYLTLSLMGLLFGVVIGSLENIHQNNPIGFRTAIVTASCAWTLIGLWVTHKD
jgi:hypothetical protein